MFTSADDPALCLPDEAPDVVTAGSADALALAADSVGCTLLQTMLRVLRGGGMVAGPEFTCLRSRR